MFAYDLTKLVRKQNTLNKILIHIRKYNEEIAFFIPWITRLCHLLPTLNKLAGWLIRANAKSPCIKVAHFKKIANNSRILTLNIAYPAAVSNNTSILAAP